MIHLCLRPRSLELASVFSIQKKEKICGVLLIKVELDMRHKIHDKVWKDVSTKLSQKPIIIYQLLFGLTC